jgi:hypothetical protein
MHVVFERRITAGIPSHVLLPRKGISLAPCKPKLFFTSHRGSVKTQEQDPDAVSGSADVDVFRLAACANCFFCLAQDAKFGDHFSEMFLHVPHTHRGKGWLASIAICGHLTRSESRYRIWVSIVRVVS